MNSLDQLDLNLLRVLDVLLEHRSVTQAARVLGRSQPAVSQSLRRLRVFFGDPLLVRHGRGLVPTPRAEALHGRVHRLLLDLRTALEDRDQFDPATSDRVFTLAAPNLLAPLVPEILEVFSAGANLHLEIETGRGIGALDTADLLLDVLAGAAPGVAARGLARLHPAVLLRRDHPALRAPWTLDAWLSWPHILVRTGDAVPSIVDRALRPLGKSRRIGLVVPDLLLVTHVVGRSDLLFTGPREVLGLLTESLGLALLEPPLDLPSVPVALMWHERLSTDAGHQWFRRRVSEVVSEALR